MTRDRFSSSEITWYSCLRAVNGLIKEVLDEKPLNSEHNRYQNFEGSVRCVWIFQITRAAYFCRCWPQLICTFKNHFYVIYTFSPLNTYIPHNFPDLCHVFHARYYTFSRFASVIWLRMHDKVGGCKNFEINVLVTNFQMLDSNCATQTHPCHFVFSISYLKIEASELMHFFRLRSDEQRAYIIYNLMTTQNQHLCIALHICFSRLDISSEM